MRKIDGVIIHCTDTSDSRDIMAEEIRQWHLDRGFDDIGYHYIIDKNGTIEEGRAVDKIGAHCKNHNETSIGICLVGRVLFNEMQLTSLHFLLLKLVDEHNIYPSNIHGHNYYDRRKTCPNLPIEYLKTFWFT